GGRAVRRRLAPHRQPGIRVLRRGHDAHAVVQRRGRYVDADLDQHRRVLAVGDPARVVAGDSRRVRRARRVHRADGRVLVARGRQRLSLPAGSLEDADRLARPAVGGADARTDIWYRQAGHTGCDRPSAMNRDAHASIGPYEGLSSLGQGGMGEVYRAVDSRLGREVALKFLDDRDAEGFERVVHEARAASALNHPNIVTVYDIGEANGRRFIVMEDVQARTLRRLIEDGEAFSRFHPLAGQVAQALVASHAARIVHRDIKPENIMVRDDGYVKVVDFGLARTLPGGTDKTVTR